MRVQDIYISTHSLLHYFDRLILSGSEGKSNGDEGYGRSLRYAALNLASLHCRFGHYQHQADLALQEAIRIAQESNDHVCLQHCLSWLYTLEQMKGSDSSVLTEDSVKMAGHFCLPYLASLGIHSLVQQGAIQDILHWKHSLSELIEISLAQTISIWRMYGKSTMAQQQAQLLLNMSSLEPATSGVQQNNTEAFAVALCHLAELHAEHGPLCCHHRDFQDTSRSSFLHTRNTPKVMLSTAELHWESSDFSTGLPLLLQALSLARQHHLQALASNTLLHLAFTQVCLGNHAPPNNHHHNDDNNVIDANCYDAITFHLMLGVPEQALSVLHEALEPILAHGAIMDKGRALMLAARCQMALVATRLNGQEQAAVAVHTLDEAATYFSILNCKERLRDVHYLKARLHNSLGQTAQRNQCAMLFHLLDPELQTPTVPTDMRL
ncbi:Anaphase-promoting complex subunit 5 [Merluccius polli]|uniref:Anaphase-promoting complex subunit 5 n=1 Tax=Merluccius polli TaxID=89951 RepID=A0AA47MVI5_MERPO|nr:Anaphase-promoting complex subunit 5 [Merluccius polli]